MSRYRIVPERSHLWIDARSSVHPIHSATDGLEGFVDLARDGDRVDLSDPPAGEVSFEVRRLKSGNFLEDREMMKRIDAKHFPTIDGALIGMESIDDNGLYRVRGSISFRGVTREYEDEMTVELLDDRTVRLDGQKIFDVREFGMEPPRILMLKVEPDVSVRVEIVAEREA